MHLRFIQIFTSLFLLIFLQQGAQAHSHHRHHHSCSWACPCYDSSSSSSSSESSERHHHHGCHHGNGTKPGHHHCPCDGPTTPSSDGSSPSSSPPDASSSPAPPSTSPSQCAQCPVSALTLTPGNATLGTATATTQIGPSDSAGCSTLNVTCTATGGQVFMQFNVEQGGPLEPIGNVVTATLNCNNENQWVYEGDGSSRVIEEVNCVLT